MFRQTTASGGRCNMFTSSVSSGRNMFEACSQRLNSELHLNTFVVLKSVSLLEFDIYKGYIR